MNSNRLKNLAANLTLAGVTVLLLVIVSELGLRLFEHPVYARHNQLFVQYDSTLGWVKVPGMQGQHTTVEYDINESFNSKGLRGPEYQYARSSDEYRVMFLGDSFAEGYSVEFDELCSEVVRRNLSARGDREYTVINAGTGGYSTDQEYLFFTNEGHRYNPDMTVLLFCTNDALGNSRKQQYRGEKPHFELNGDDLVLTNVPVPKPEIASEDARDDSIVDRAKQWLFGNSYIYAHIRQAMVANQRLYRFLIEHGLAERDADTFGDKMIPEEFRYFSRSKDSVSQKAWNTTEAILVHLSREVASAGSRLLVYYVPSSAAVYDEEWQATLDQYDMSDDEWSIHQVGVDLEAICRRNNIDFIDPTQRFIEAARSLEEDDRRLYFPRDRHWTAEGQRLCGDMITDYIIEKLDAGDKTRTARFDDGRPETL